MSSIKYCLRLAVLIGAFASTSIAQAQVTKAFKGKVTDKNGAPVPGMTVEVQEQNRRTQTASDGSFTIQSEVGELLIFSKKGFTSFQKRTGDALEINVVVEPSIIGGGEEDDIVIPFGIKKKRALTYAVSQLNANEIPQLPVSNVTALLAGRLSGLNVLQTSTTPGNAG
ncbi:MAG: carboxypeptidase regulatory-like domain-containing protein, partial [Chitinophagaceae bacterium]